VPLPTQAWNPVRKFLQWEKHKQGELEVLPKRVLTCFQSMPDKSEVLPKGVLMCFQSMPDNSEARSLSVRARCFSGERKTTGERLAVLPVVKGAAL